MVDCPRRHAVNRPFPCGFGKEGKLEGSAMGDGDRLPCKISNNDTGDRQEYVLDIDSLRSGSAVG